MRAGATISGHPIESPPVHVHAVAAADAPTALAERFEPLHIDAPHAATVTDFANTLCTLHEYHAARTAIDRVPAGGLVLLDGALHDLPHPARDLVRLLQEAADHRSVHLVGVARSSGLQTDGRPLVPALRLQGIERLPGTTWSCTLQTGLHVCLLEPRAERAYRIDTLHPEALARLVPLSRDQNHRGYPYPLAQVRRTVALDDAHLEQLRHRT